MACRKAVVETESKMLIVSRPSISDSWAPLEQSPASRSSLPSWPAPNGWKDRAHFPQICCSNRTNTMLCSTARSSHGSRRRRPSRITSATRRPSYHMHAFPAHRHGTMIAILTTSKPPTNRKQTHTLYRTPSVLIYTNFVLKCVVF